MGKYLLPPNEGYSLFSLGGSKGRPHHSTLEGWSQSIERSAIPASNFDSYGYDERRYRGTECLALDAICGFEGGATREPETDPHEAGGAEEARERAAGFSF